MQPEVSPLPTLSNSTEHRASLYSMAAAAAGVSLMALASSAEAKVVITTHISIPVTGTVSLDLNHDGISDIALHMGGYQPLGFRSTYLSARGSLTGNGILGRKE